MNTPTTSYTTRLQSLEKIVGGKKFGLLGGIYLQTKWQRDSGRDTLALWSYINESVTIAPYSFYREHAENPDLFDKESPYVLSRPTRDRERAPITHEDVRRAWKNYFLSEQKASLLLLSKNPLQKIVGVFFIWYVVSKSLWRAHNSSIKHALWQKLDELGSTPVPKQEFDFWVSWVRLVFWCEKFFPLTTTFTLKQLLQITMPPCSPLGASHCTIESQPLLRRIFLKIISRYAVQPKDFFQTN